MLDEESLRATVPDAYGIRPAYVKGFQRDFSFWDAAGWTESNLDLRGEAFCAVDAKASYIPGSLMNGIIFQMSETNYDRLLRREAGYELIKTKVYSFGDSSLLGECLLFSSGRNDGAYNFESLAQNRYLEVCLRGASKYGKDFYEQFLDTTFINSRSLKETPTLAEICKRYS